MTCVVLPSANVPVMQGVSGAVKRRMLLTAQHPEMELRPMLLFPEVQISVSSSVFKWYMCCRVIAAQ
jgi:hypothetical protein